MQVVSIGDNLHLMSNPISWEIRKYFKMSFAENFSQSALALNSLQCGNYFLAYAPHLRLFLAYVTHLRLAPVSSNTIFIIIILFDTSTKIKPKLYHDCKDWSLELISLSERKV